MDLVEKYIEDVKVLLPARQREDIAEELEGILRGRLEEKAAELGRPLSKDEEEEVLRAYGHPMMVAARYLPTRTLIGPELYPLWWLGARAALIADVAIHVMQAVAAIALHPERAAERVPALFGDMFSFFFVLIGALTVSLAVVERFNLKPFGEWNPRNRMKKPARPFGGPPARFESSSAAIGSIVGVVFWAALPWWPSWGPQLFGRWVDFTGREMSVTLGPIWWPVLWAMVLAGGVVGIIAHVAAFVRPQDRAAFALWRMLENGWGVVIAAVAISAGPLFNFDSPAGHAVNEALGVERWIGIALVFAAVGYAGAFLWYAWRFFQERGGAVQSRGAVTG